MYYKKNFFSLKIWYYIDHHEKKYIYIAYIHMLYYKYIYVYTYKEENKREERKGKNIERIQLSIRYYE